VLLAFAVVFKLTIDINALRTLPLLFFFPLARTGVVTVWIMAIVMILFTHNSSVCPVCAQWDFREIPCVLDEMINGVCDAIGGRHWHQLEQIAQ